MDVQSFHSPLSHFDATGLIDSMPQPMLVLDAEGCVVFANAAALRVLSLSMRELQGQPLDLLFIDGQRLRAALSRLVVQDVPQRPARFAVRELARPERQLALKVTVFDDEFSGPHLLIQLARVRALRRRPALTLMPSITLDRPPDRPQLECA